MTDIDWRSFVGAMQHRAALALGIDEQRRTETVVAMLENNRRRAPGYWLQLALSVGIATFGLVLDSTAVVIGAMLVSPLMGPIVELGMGFAVGSAFLVFRASIRVAMSVAVVVAGAAVLTLALPFHEVTSELSARAAPTALDLLVAVFCALTAAYTTVRTTSDTTTAAAGTAIGISLVPPLCATGFGIGTGVLSITGGAGLLFIANFSAILVFSVLSFLALGYNQVSAESVERDLDVAAATRADVLAARAQRLLHRAFGSRYGIAMRILIPVVFLAAVYVPLRRALVEVTWEVRARDAIRRITGAEAPDAVQTTVTVERHGVTLRLLVVGSDTRAASLERSIRARIAGSTGVTPDVTVTAVPDARTLAAATRSESPESPNAVDVATLRTHTAAALDAVWPSVAGPLAGWDLVIPSRDEITIVLRHLGAPLGVVGENLIARALSTHLAAPVRVTDAPLATTTTAPAPLGAEARWLATAQPLLDWVALAPGANACVRGPVASSRQTTAPQRAAITTIAGSAAAHAGRVTIADSSGWRITVVAGACPKTDSTRVAP